VREGLRAEESLVEGSQEGESWEGLTDEEGSSTSLQDGWGGFPGESEAWEGPRGEREGSASRSGTWEGSTGRSEAWEGATGEGISGKGLTEASEAWEGPQESRESSIALVEGPHKPQGQYYSSCNRKKPLIAFGQFFTCDTCRERNKRANRARHVRVRKAVPLARRLQESN
jgi:hypothetical protein